MNKEVYVIDIETLKSCFTLTVFNINTSEVKQYVLHKDRNDIKQLIDFLSLCKGMIGFNNISFDYPVLHYFWCNKKSFQLLDVKHVINQLYLKAQECIDKSRNKEYSHIISEKDWICPQLDLFRLWHYNNKARSTNLKSLEISMNYPNVMDMPISHKEENINISQVDEILEYNLNDVMATYEFYLKSKDKIELRNSLRQQFNINCRNWSDSKIGEQLVLKLYSEASEIDISDIKDLRSNRKEIVLNDIILSYIKFESKEFNELLNFFKSKIVVETKGAIEKSVIYKGFKYDFGLGGVHGVSKSGIYESNEKFIIKSFDVSSLYPSLSIQNKLFPEHLGEIFVDVYKSLVDRRLEAKKAKNMILSDAFKLSANSVYGKSNDEFSFLYDPKFTMSITLGGQLSLVMLCEKLSNIPDSKMLMLNTDGGEILIPNNEHSINMFNNICKEWENITKLTLEFVDYQKLIIGDVNNYIGITSDGKIKTKGRFEVDKVVGSEPAYHKDNSFKIIPLALREYFVNNIPVEQTIYAHKDIYDFCGRQKFSTSIGKTHCLAYNHCGMPYEEIVKQQKNVRYYISNNGDTFVKYYDKGSKEFIHVGYKVTIFNKYIELPFEEYDVNYNYYIKECYKEIDNIIDRQLNLF